MTLDPRIALRRFAEDEAGSALLPVVIWVPLFVLILLTAVEFGHYTARHTMLERAVDQTVRDVRLGTGTNYTRTSLKTAICDRAAILPECMDRLELQMVRLDLRDWAPPSNDIPCEDVTVVLRDSEGNVDGVYDTSDAVHPVVAFEYGRENEMMLLTACYAHVPILPSYGFARLMVEQNDSVPLMRAKAAFVHEPY